MQSFAPSVACGKYAAGFLTQIRDSDPRLPKGAVENTKWCRLHGNRRNSRSSVVREIIAHRHRAQTRMSGEVRLELEREIRNSFDKARGQLSQGRQDDFRRATSGTAARVCRVTFSKCGEEDRQAELVRVFKLSPQDFHTQPDQRIRGGICKQDPTKPNRIRTKERNRAS
jgi:hypothetical protein